MNPAYLRSIGTVLSQPKEFCLFIGLPIVLILLFKWGYRRAGRRNEIAIARLSKKYGRDLLSAFPNFTGTFYSIGIWTGILSILSVYGSAYFVLSKQITPEILEKSSIVRNSSHGGVMATSISDFIVMTIAFTGLASIAIIYAMGWGSAVMGLLCERYLRKRFDASLGVEKPPTFIAVLHEPYWPRLYRRWGGKARYWPFHIRFSGTRNKRSVLITREAQGEADHGYFIDTMPKLPRCPKWLFWTLMMVSFFTPLQFVFFPYAFLLSARCIFMPDASLERKKAS